MTSQGGGRGEAWLPALCMQQVGHCAACTACAVEREPGVNWPFWAARVAREAGSAQQPMQLGWDGNRLPAQWRGKATGQPGLCGRTVRVPVHPHGMWPLSLWPPAAWTVGQACTQIKKVLNTILRPIKISSSYSSIKTDLMTQLYYPPPPAKWYFQAQSSIQLQQFNRIASEACFRNAEENQVTGS